VRIGRLLLSSSLLLSLALLAGRASGFLRELLIAARLGVSAQADVAVLVLSLPDLLVNLLLSGGLSVALVPVMRNAPDRAASVFLQASLLVGALFGVLGLSFVVLPDVWFRLMAPGMLSPSMAVGNGGVLAIALALPLAALAGVSSAYLNARDRFFVAGCGTLLFNVCILAALLAWHQAADATVLTVLCWAILAGSLLRWASQVAALPRDVTAGHLHQRVLTGPLLRAFTHGLVATSLLVLVPAIVRALASLTGEGNVAAVNYATKLVELPVGVLITTLATVAYPHLSELHAKGQEAQARKVLCERLQRALLLSWVVLIFGLAFADALVDVLFGRGQVGPVAVNRIASLTRIALLSVPLVAISSLAAADLNARGRTGVVLKLTLGCLLALPVMAWPAMHHDSPASLIGALVGFQLVLAVALARTAGLRWHGEDGVAGAKILAAVAASAGPLLVGLALDRGFALTDGLVRSALALLFFVCSVFLGVRLLPRRDPVVPDTRP
jgi:putative peptidoglycan lipid II flippase